MKTVLTISVTILLFFLVACEKDTNKPADNYLSGKWTEHVPDGIGYFVAMLHSFSFHNDSFNAKIVSWTDVAFIIRTKACDTCPYTIDSCASNFGYEENYWRGKYILIDDSIYFSGKECDSLFKNDIQPKCNTINNYNERFSYIKNDTVIILNPDRQCDFGYGIILKKE